MPWYDFLMALWTRKASSSLNFSRHM
jgi:hypothetical protein